MKYLYLYTNYVQNGTLNKLYHKNVHPKPQNVVFITFYLNINPHELTLSTVSSVVDKPASLASEGLYVTNMPMRPNDIEYNTKVLHRYWHNGNGDREGKLNFRTI